MTGPFACGGLFRPIRLQHKWMMTTSFTCSTGLGDKLVPPLLPGMFRAAVCTTPERAVCHRWWRVALKRREEPSHHRYSRAAGGRGENMWTVAFSEGFVKTEEVVYPSSRKTLKVKLPFLWICWALFWKVSCVFFFFSFSTLWTTFFFVVVEILLRTAVQHALWFIMQIYSTHSRFPL